MIYLRLGVGLGRGGKMMLMFCLAVGNRGKGILRVSWRLDGIFTECFFLNFYRGGESGKRNTQSILDTARNIFGMLFS